MLLCYPAVSIQGHKQHKQELTLPANLPMGHLRRTVAEWLAKAPQFVRLLGGVSAGCLCLEDCCTLPTAAMLEVWSAARADVGGSELSAGVVVDAPAAAPVLRNRSQRARQTATAGMRTAGHGTATGLGGKCLPAGC